MFKAIDLYETVEYISEKDPAINKQESNLPLYQSTLDVNHLVLDGEPTIFVLGTVTSKEMARIQDTYISADISNVENTSVKPFGLSREMTMYGLRDVKGVDGFRFKTVGGNPQRVSDRSMDQLTAWGVVEELGNRIMSINELNESEKKQ